MVTLYQFKPAWDLPSLSPFCMKVEVYLRMAGLNYKTIHLNTPRTGPKHKLPYIEDDHKIISDSAFILDYLKNTYGDNIDNWLTPEDQALSLAMRRLIEEHLYWAILYSRWIYPAGFKTMTNLIFTNIQAPISKFIYPRVLKRYFSKQLWAQGLGRHSENEVFQIGMSDIDALSNLLGRQSYFLGDKPSSLDATAYAFLANIIGVPIESPLKRHALQIHNLNAYCERMKTKYFPYGLKSIR
jgi:glutathione S-transferase